MVTKRPLTLPPQSSSLPLAYYRRKIPNPNPSMEDGDGGLSFDFEGGLDSAPAVGGPVPSSADPGAGGGGGGDGPGMHGRGRGRGSYRQTVCRHWLRGLCMKGDACGFLHQFDKARMPVCRFFRDFGECREPDCAYKHSYDDVKECNM